MKPAYEVFLAEDHVRFRGEIKKIINGIPGVEVRGEAGDGIELFDLLEKSQPDLVIMDISMPNLRAMKATREIKSKYPEIKVIIMAMDNENEYCSHAIAAGAEGIVLKQESAVNLELAVQQIRQGKSYFPKVPKDKKTGSDTLVTNLFDRLTSLSFC
ncbi:MAG: response regulator transcription factor [Deltaproteobacteria bacterium]|nr:response regulator transcription factor [Deltaproteobacteria bacterium]